MFLDFWLLPARFWTNFGSKMVEVLLLKLCPVAFPTPEWTPKAVWTPLGSVQGPFWEHIKSTFGKFWRKFWSKFLIKTIVLRIYLHISVVPISLSCVRVNALRQGHYWKQPLHFWVPLFAARWKFLLWNRPWPPVTFLQAVQVYDSGLLVVYPFSVQLSQT